MRLGTLSAFEVSLLKNFLYNYGSQLSESSSSSISPPSRNNTIEMAKKFKAFYAKYEKKKTELDRVLFSASPPPSTSDA